MRTPTSDDPEAWETFLASEGLGKKLPRYPGVRVRFGNGLGVKTEAEERLEEKGGHSSVCPISLRPLNDDVDRPNDRPVEKASRI